MLIARTLVAMVLVYALTGASQAVPRKHTISFTFDYDFRIIPACSSKVTKGCIQFFDFYDISAGIPTRVKLGSIPVPPGATGLVRGISATTQPLLFEPGKHLLAVTAEMSNGSESDSGKCTIWVEVP